ncbi:MAG TPA: DUF2339 domain-containing protein, partial [Alphaproteobacteria bacterium]|nr:DUF2339 domain-containing protein [Alphaproteobacteria bacterium]
MLGLEFLIGIALVGFYLVWSPILLLLDHRKINRITAELTDLRHRVALLKQPPEEATDERSGETAQAPRPAEPEWRPVADAPPRHQPEAERPATAKPQSTTEDWADLATDPKLLFVGHDLEERLSSRWLVWLGGATIALAGFFLVKYSFDQGWLGPGMRVLLGILLGTLLVAGGEWLRRRPVAQAIPAIRPDYVPPATTAAGIAISFGSVWAAYALYGLVPNLVAFALLAFVSASAVILSLLQGPFIAVLGLVGAYTVPALVATDQPSAVALFAYAASITVGGLALVRWTGWRWLAWLSLAGSFGWALLWLLGTYARGDAPVLTAYILALVALFVFLPRPGRATEPFAFKPALDPDRGHTPTLVATVGAAGLALGLVWTDGFGTASVIGAGLVFAALMAVARREPMLEPAALAAALVALVLLATWHLAASVEAREALVLGGIFSGYQPWSPIVPEALWPFATAATAFALLFGVAAYVALWGASRPGLWATLGTATPVLVLVISYLRITGYQISLPWATISLALAGAALAAAAGISRRRHRGTMDAALGAYAAATVAAISLAFAMTLEEAWLTVAIALLLPAIAWIDNRLQVAGLRRVALLLVGLVMARLALNPWQLDYPLSPTPVFNWLLYGYGIPAVAFYLASRLFRRRLDDGLVTSLEAGSLIFFVLLASLEVRHLVGGGELNHNDYGLFERSLHALVWGSTALGLYRRAGRDRWSVPLWGFRILGTMAVAQVLVLQVLVMNPYLTGESVWQPPLVNLLLLAYGIPVLLALLIFRLAQQRQDRTVVSTAAALALVLPMIELTLEVRHAYHGEFLRVGSTGSAEIYTYSLAWLLYAGLLLGLGIGRRLVAVRYAALAILLITVAKVSLYD